MRLIFLGTGTSTGVPVIGCNCRVCVSGNPYNKRLRTSLYVEISGKKILIDVSPDFREQALRNRITSLDAVLITHGHADHINGFDDIRQVNFSMNWKVIPVYANKYTCEEIRKRFDYVFKNSTQLGGGKPLIELFELDDYDKVLLGNLEILSFIHYHGKIRASSYRIFNLAYITDVSFIPTKTLKLLEGVETLIISGLRYLPHATHFSISEVENLVRALKPKITYLTHMGHDIDYDEILKRTGKNNIFPAYDGLEVNV